MSHHHVLPVVVVVSLVVVVVSLVVVGPGIALQVRWNPWRVSEPSVSKLISTLDVYFLVNFTIKSRQT